MKTKHTTLLITAILGLNAQTTFAQTVSRVAQDGRCGGWGDSLEQKQAATRNAFASGCLQSKYERLNTQFNNICAPGSEDIICQSSQDSLVRMKETIKTIGEVGKGISYSATNNTQTAGYATYGRFDPTLNDYTNLTLEENVKWFAPPRTPLGNAANTPQSCDTIPKRFEIVFFCASGCYSPEQLLLTSTGYVDARTAVLDNQRMMVTLSDASEPEILRFKHAAISRVVKDRYAGLQEMLEFKMASGGSLKVTPNHPIVAASGFMKKAAEFTIGDAFVKQDGSRDPIVKITPSTENLKVYNLDIDSESPTEKVIVAQGYLNGSVYYQDEEVMEANRKLLRINAADIIQ